MDIFAHLSFDTVALIVIGTAVLREVLLRLRQPHQARRPHEA